MPAGWSREPSPAKDCAPPRQRAPPRRRRRSHGNTGGSSLGDVNIGQLGGGVGVTNIVESTVADLTDPASLNGLRHILNTHAARRCNGWITSSCQRTASWWCHSRRQCFRRVHFSVDHRDTLQTCCREAMSSGIFQQIRPGCAAEQGRNVAMRTA